MKIIKWFIERRNKKAEAEKKAIADEKIKGKVIIAEHKRNMLSKPCPINKGQNCSDTCVHFCDGWVGGRYDSMFGWYYRLASCKLWSK